MQQNQILEDILNNPHKLSDSQKDAVVSDNQHVRIIAGAGAGKTETLTRKIVYLLLYKEVPPSSIVAFTFTEKAAQSMKTRIYDRVKAFGGEEICAHLGEMFVGTIHAYCSLLLEDFYGYGDYGTLDENQEMAFIMRYGWNLNLGGKGYASNCRQFLDTLNVVYGELIPENVLKKRSPDFLQKMKGYEDLLNQNKLLTFNLMINIAIEELSKNPSKLENVKHLIVDEYQDINRAQEQLIQLIGDNSNIFIVGDPRQTIYQWRGSDERCFEEFEVKYPDTKTIKITENRRSTKLIIELANNFSDNFESTYPHMSPTRKEDGHVFLKTLEDERQEAEWIADQIETHINEGSCKYSDIGILCRSVNTTGPAFIDVFRERRIPLMIGGKVGLFRRDEIKCVGKLFTWLYDDAFWKDNKYSKESIEGEDILFSALDDWAEGVPDVPLPDNIAESLLQWKESVLKGGFNTFIDIFYSLLNLLNYKKLNPDDPNHAVIMANMGRFSSLITDYEYANRLGGRKKNWERDVKGLFWFIHSYATSSYEEQPADDLESIDAVQLTTVHQAKGLEWALVFIPALVNKRFPSIMTGRTRHWDIPKDLFDYDRYEGDIDSERKLFYVALTRAKNTLVLSKFTRLKNSEPNASEFVKEELDHSLIESLSSRDYLPLCNVTNEGENEDLQTFATNELITYGQCPYMYRLNNVWGYKTSVKELIGYGNTLHFCLRRSAELIRDKGMSPISAVATSVDENFFLPYASPKMFDKLKEGAKKRLIQFAKKHSDDMVRIKEVESRIEFPMQKATVVGRVDVILHDDQGLEVRDYKTSDVVISDEEAALQVQLYTAGLQKIGEPADKGSISYLENASTSDVDVSLPTLENKENIAESYIDGITKRDFTPCPGEICKKCNYVNICKYKRNE